MSDDPLAACRGIAIGLAIATAIWWLILLSIVIALEVL